MSTSALDIETLAPGESCSHVPKHEPSDEPLKPQFEMWLRNSCHTNFEDVLFQAWLDGHDAGYRAGREGRE